MTVDSSPLDLEELLARSLRGIAADLRRASLGWLYDSRLPPVLVFGEAAPLASSLHALFHTGTQLLDGGVLMVDASGTILRDRLRWHVRAAGTRVVDDRQRVAMCIEQQGLHDAGGNADTRLQRARGRCPRTGAAIDFAARADHGFLFKFDLVLPIAGAMPLLLDGEASGARAWVIDHDDAAAQILARRLQRIGWATWQFRSAEQAARRLELLSDHQARPALVIGVESAAVDAAGMLQLQARLPAGTVVALGVTSGSPSLAAASSLAIHALPFDTTGLRHLTVRSVPAAQAASGTTLPAPLGLEHRPALLVVDDDEVVRTVLCGLGHSLGFEVHAVDDGGQALQACTRTAFDAALIDYCMPAINGVDLTRRLRELQHQGLAPPFPIVGASADADHGVQQQWRDAGAAAFLRKPLSRDEMQTVFTRLHVRVDEARP